MKENLQVLLQSLRDEKSRLEEEKRGLARQLETLNKSRMTTARRCLSELLPDLEMSTIKSLARQVPGFEVPVTSGFLGFGKKVDPSVSLNSLRMKLGAHLDNTSGAVPESWKSDVKPIDASIRDLQENLIRSNAERIADVGARITALEKLVNVDLTKMNPKVRSQLEQAVASQARNPRASTRSYSSVRGATPVNTVYPSQTQIHSDSGPSLLEMWFWWQILTPNSECSHEVHRIESGGSFGGGGASGNWDSIPSQNSAPSPVGLGLVANEAFTPSARPEDIGTHYSLGASNFS